MATNSEQSYEDWLEREDFDDDFEDLTDSEIKELIDDIWNKQDYDHTGKQLDAMKDAIRNKQAAARPIAEPLKPDYFRHSGGNQYPRLAARGIKRITYTSGGTRFTRYSIPGSRGLYSLGSARKIFHNL